MVVCRIGSTYYTGSGTGGRDYSPLHFVGKNCEVVKSLFFEKDDNSKLIVRDSSQC